jgi:phosphatidylserine/phosphatidylglycerophosphate/cardiolipin synthase-like enzyme
MGLAIRSPKLAELFTEILESDMAVAEATPEMLQLPSEEEIFLVERTPRGPEKKFKSKKFSLDSILTAIPVLSPDNYMDVMPGLLAKARKSIFIEQQYIRAKQPKITKLLQAIGVAKSNAPELDVRIVLGKIFDATEVPAEQAMLDHLENVYGLKLGPNVRYINTNQFVHCHNKMVIIDGAGVLVSSQNWSDSAVWKNREAGVFLKHKGIASYFTDIFEHDWGSAFQELPESAAGPEMLTPQLLSDGGFIRVEKADYQEV